MPLTPFFRSPFTDFTGGLINSQHYDKCGEFELDMLECMEAYGQDKGKVKCRDLIEDYYECFSQTKSRARFDVSAFKDIKII
jgi:NADH dehydrogenase (ubiquinone) Fe-S protein 5